MFVQVGIQGQVRPSDNKPKVHGSATQLQTALFQVAGAAPTPPQLANTGLDMHQASTDALYHCRQFLASRPSWPRVVCSACTLLQGTPEVVYGLPSTRETDIDLHVACKDYQILELALRDICTIQDVRNLYIPVVALSQAYSLNQAYQVWMKKLRLEGLADRRSWEDQPNSQVLCLHSCV